MALFRTIAFVLSLALPCAAFADATSPTADVAGARDPAWLKRYEGSHVVSHEQRAFDAVAFPASKLLISEPDERDLKNNRVFDAKRVVKAEGEYTRLVYIAPVDRSPLEVLRNYTDLVEEGGGTLLYSCEDKACGGDIHGNAHGGGWQGLMDKIYPANRAKDPPFSNGSCATSGTPGEQLYTLAQMPDGNGGQRTLGLYAFSIRGSTSCKALDGRTGMLVVAVAPRARENKMVTVSSADMAEALQADGRISLYGILFDTNKSAVKPESRPALEQVAALLAAQPKLQLRVVGHTDDVGGAKANLALSKRRADAVVAALAEDFGVDAERLLAEGAGMSKPVAPNDGDAGRAKNRRVELVKR